MPITTPTPLTIGTADKLWLTSFRLTRATLVTTAAPYNGERLAGNPSDVRRVAVYLDRVPAAKSLADDLFASVARIAGAQAADVQFLNVRAADPSQPVTAEAGIRGIEPSGPGHASWQVADLFALLASDQQLATAYAAVLAFVQQEVD